MDTIAHAFLSTIASETTETRIAVQEMGEDLVLELRLHRAHLETMTDEEFD